jgi:DnaJ-class molecular chaperone
MARTSTPVQQVTCPACRGAGTVPVTIQNTATKQWHTNNETCLNCMGTGTVTR